MLGYIRDGVYHKGPPIGETPTPSSLAKAADHDDQRFMHQADLVQPYLPDGKTNPEFLELYYEEAKNFGLIDYQSD